MSHLFYIPKFRKKEKRHKKEKKEKKEKKSKHKKKVTLRFCSMYNTLLLIDIQSSSFSFEPYFYNVCMAILLFHSYASSCQFVFFDNRNLRGPHPRAHPHHHLQRRKKVRGHSPLSLNIFIVVCHHIRYLPFSSLSLPIHQK
jgi:hypothetical protein